MKRIRCLATIANARFTTNTAKAGWKAADLADLAGKILAIFLAILARYLRAYLGEDLADLADKIGIRLKATLQFR